MMSSSRGLTIIHVDMDAFFASVEQLDNPSLVGKPVIVGAKPGGRGVVSAASYEARAFGVHSAMPISAAVRLCPQGVFLPVRFERYGQFSRQIRDIFHDFTPLVEPLSSDEAFLDVAGSEGLFGSAEEIGRKIKERIRVETGLTASVGVAPNKFLAKLASDLKKPNGFVILPEEKVRETLDPLPVGKLWGVGKKAEMRLNALGYKTIGQIADANVEILVRAFGSSARHLWELANGIDSRVVTPDRLAKSLSADTTFPEDISSPESLRHILFELLDHLAWRLRKKGVKAAVLEVKLRSSDFITRGASKTLLQPLDQALLLLAEARPLLEGLLADMLPARLLSVGASRLAWPGETQQSLFDGETREKLSGVDRAVDAIKARFGEESIGRAAFLDPATKKEKPRS
ncbi:MAG: DNA polymerase IV [Gemmataceae bacterium]|nr:DNA polymerase IV [Gemmataceae bacterium]